MRKNRLTKKQRDIINTVISQIQQEPDLQLTRKNLCRDLAIVSEVGIKEAFGSFSNFKALLFENLKSDRQTKHLAAKVTNVKSNKPAVKQNASIVEEINQDWSYSDLFKNGWVDKEKYWWNPKTRSYMFDLKTSYLVLKEKYIKKLIKLYTSSDTTLTTQEIAHKLNTSPEILSKVVRALKITHADLPITDEMLEEKSDELIAEDINAERRLKIYKKVENDTLKDLQKDASLWRLCKAGQIEPVLKALGASKEVFNTHPPAPVSIEITKAGLDYKEDETLCVCLSDIHFGALAHAENLSFADHDLNLEYTARAVQNYIQQIIERCEKRGVMPSHCMVLSVGDIIHTLTGITSRGTPIEADKIGITQWHCAMEALSYLFSSLSKIFKTVTCYSVPGNHDRIGDILLFASLKYQFDKTNVEVVPVISRWAQLNIGDNSIIIEHGESARFRNSKTPASGPKRDAFVLSVFNNLEQSQNTKGKRYYITGHYHSFSWQTCRGYEAISLPTINPPDEYADELGYADNNDHQVCFIMKDVDGITELWKIFPEVSGYDFL